VASTVANGRKPWLEEPRCGNCHAAQFAEETGKLFRQSKGHGGLFCSACHGSPHAIQPTVIERDNVQNITLQGYSGPLRDCTVCHGTAPTAPGPHGRTATAVSEQVSPLPDDLGLGQNYPNPFNPTTVIPFSLSKSGQVRLEVFNGLGEKVATLVDREVSAGEYWIPFAGNGLPSGRYSYRLVVDGKIASKAMTFIK
jgi:hypothetical protein